MAKATLYNKGCACSCDRRIEDNCTTCCPVSLGSDSFSESHGYDECPKVSKPCGSEKSASCSSRKIGPKTLRSQPFPTDCLTKFNPVAAVSLSADNFGMATGKSGKVGCPPSNACTTCGQAGVLTPLTESLGGGKSRLKVTAYGQNSVHGGPYSLFVSASFSLVPK